MEIREHLSVYLESGYLFDDMSGKLKWFEIDKILISFTYGVVRYVGTWGGCRTEKTLDGKLFYSSEECFKKGKSIPKTKLSIYDVFESLYGFVPIGDVWKYKNGRAVKGELEYFDVEIDNKGKIYCKETYYRTREDVYKFNDLTVVDKNGSDDKMESFIIQMVFNKDDKIILDDIGYHKIGSIFKYNIDSKEVELEVVESSDASCEGCAFNNSKNYYCKDTHCIDVDRKDDIDVIYKKVKRS